MLKPMDDAPFDDNPIVILTPVAAHRALWDGPYGNFWSLTANRAMTEEESLGWMTTDEWNAFLRKSSS